MGALSVTHAIKPQITVLQKYLLIDSSTTKSKDMHVTAWGAAITLGRNSESGSLSFGVEDKAKKKFFIDTPQTHPNTPWLTERNETESKNDLFEQ